MMKGLRISTSTSSLLIGESQYFIPSSSGCQCSDTLLHKCEPEGADINAGVNLHATHSRPAQWIRVCCGRR
eukprot:513428-Amphidinium_carterae.1